MMTPKDKQWARDQIEYRRKQETPENKFDPWYLELKFQAIQIKNLINGNMGRDDYIIFMFDYSLRQIREKR